MSPVDWSNKSDARLSCAATQASPACPAMRRRFQCNVCTLPNEVPMEYFAGLDQAGRRLDEAERPELTCGTVDYVAPREYMVSCKQ